MYENGRRTSHQWPLVAQPPSYSDSSGLRQWQLASTQASKLSPPAPQHQKDAASEKSAVKLLKLDIAPVESALVPTQIHCVKVSSEHAKTLQLGAGFYHAYKTP